MTVRLHQGYPNCAPASRLLTPPLNFSCIFLKAVLKRPRALTKGPFLTRADIQGLIKPSHDEQRVRGRTRGESSAMKWSRPALMLSVSVAAPAPPRTHALRRSLAAAGASRKKCNINSPPLLCLNVQSVLTCAVICISSFHSHYPTSAVFSPLFLGIANFDELF